MAGFTEEVVVQLKDQFSDGAKKVSQAAEGIQGAFRLAKLAVAGLIFNEVTDQIKKAYKEFAEAELVTKQLEHALKEMGVTSKSVLKDYIAFSESTADHTLFGKEEILNMERLFTQYGLYGEQLKRATRATLDFAQARGLDSQTAANIFIRAAAGNTEALSKYGIHADQAKIATGGLNAVLEASEAAFKGTAEAAGNTAAGRMDQFAKSVKNLYESVGGLVAQFDKNVGVTKFWSEQIKSLTHYIEESNEPLDKMNSQLSDLVKHQQELQMKIGTPTQKGMGAAFFETIFGSFDANSAKQDLEQTTEKIEKLRESIQKIQAEENKGSTTPIKKVLYDSKELIDAKNAYQAFYNGIVESSEVSYAKIDATRKKDLDAEKEKWDKMLQAQIRASKDYDKFLQEHNDAIARVEKKATQARIEETKNNMVAGLNAVQNFTSQVSSNTLGAFGGLTKDIGNLVGKMTGNGAFGLVGEVFNAVVGVGQAVGSLFSMFDKDTRTYFMKLSDYLSAIDHAIDETEARLKNIEDHQDRADQKLEGTIKGRPYGDNDIMGYLTQAGNEVGVNFQTNGGFVAARNRNSLLNQIKNHFDRGAFNFRITDSGNLEILAFQYVLGILSAKTGKWTAVTRWLGNSSEADNILICQYLLDEFKRQGLMDLSALGVPKDQRASANGPSIFVDGGGSSGSSSGGTITRGFASSAGTSSVFAPSAGDSTSSGSMTININTIDSQGVRDFTINQLAPVMRDLSGRSGVVFLNSNGVSDNI